MSRPRVYYDNVIASALVAPFDDLPAEMSAIATLEAWDAEQRIERVTSKMSPIEQARTRDPNVRAKLAANVGAVPQVANDHRLLGIQTYDSGRYGSLSYPLLSDIVDESLYAALRAAGMADVDAKHVMYAKHNGCDYFVTLDTKDILPHRVEIESACGGLRVVTPSELVAML